MQIEREWCTALMRTQLCNTMMDEAYIIWHSSGDGHKLVSVYSLQ